MQFNEPTFLFLFLPVLLAIYYTAPARWPGLRNLILLAATAVFATWAGRQTVWLLGAALVFNYGAALLVARRTRGALAGGITANLILLGWCKYATFITSTLAALYLPVGPVPKLPAPPGISFFTFVAIAYLVDVARGDATALRHPVQAGQFLVFFSRLFAGPIVRCRDIGNQLAARPVRREQFVDGVRRFIIGLGKKVLVAGTVAGAADRIFGLNPADLTAPLAWAGLACYTIQIYFDFAGYTDMAIGLGAMFGFQFPENFNYPYAATSLRDFWRRWHMTLSGWLRDYLYIPLGGSRCAPWRVYLNLLIVFTLCGLWHGASWTFVIWGLFQGVFLALERLGGDRLLEKSPRLVQHGYAVAVVMTSWVFFRADTLPHALRYLAALAGVNHPAGVTDGLVAFLTPPVFMALVAGGVGALPVVPFVKNRLGAAWPAWETAALVFILGAAVIFVAARTYAPFIYAQF